MPLSNLLRPMFTSSTPNCISIYDYFSLYFLLSILEGKFLKLENLHCDSKKGHQWILLTLQRKTVRRFASFVQVLQGKYS